VDPRLDVYAEPQRLVRVAGRRRLNVHDTGAGAPTVVLIAGMGGTTISWTRVQRRLAETQRVISFDRARYAFSDRARLPRTASDHLADLRAALAAIDAHPPYVVVGHSAGSYEARLFAVRHPGEVAGLVLVDPSTEHQFRRFEAIDATMGRRNDDTIAECKQRERQARNGELPDEAYDVFPGLPPKVDAVERAWLSRPTSWRTRRVELETFATRSSDEVAAECADLDDTNTIVLTAAQALTMPGLTEADRQPLLAEWFRMHDEMVARTTRGERRTIDTEHNIQLLRPDAVVDAVRDVVGLTSAPRPP
jgi:pimeloyl-ACP methyl ester carboxylesterase